MGRDRQSQSETTKNTETAEEKQLNQLQLSQSQEFDPIQRQLNANGGNLINQLLTGQGLPGYLGQLPGGIDQGVTDSIVKQSLRDVGSQFNQNGILDSGVAQSIGARTAGDIRTQSAQFNLQNLQNLLSMAIGGQQSVQQPILSQNQALGGRLQGLRKIDRTGFAIGQNPFLKSYQQSAGQSLGKSTSDMITGAITGGFKL